MGMGVGFQRKGSEMNATTVAVDLAKSVFQIALADANWMFIESHRLTRTQFERWFAKTGWQDSSSCKPVARRIIGRAVRRFHVGAGQRESTIDQFPCVLGASIYGLDFSITSALLLMLPFLNLKAD